MCMCVLQVHCGREAIVACSEYAPRMQWDRISVSCPLQCPVPYACESFIVVEVTGAVESARGCSRQCGGEDSKTRKREEILQQVGRKLASADAHADSVACMMRLCESHRDGVIALGLHYYAHVMAH